MVSNRAGLPGGPGGGGGGICQMGQTPRQPAETGNRPGEMPARAAPGPEGGPLWWRLWSMVFAGVPLVAPRF